MARSLIPYAIAVTLVLATLGVLTHSHLNLFSCTRDDFVYGAGRGGYGMQSREPARCSLMYFTDDELKRYNAKLDASGRALAVFVGLVLPFVIGLGIGRALVRRKAT